jgi:DNA-binding MarR family transcriptional regulator
MQAKTDTAAALESFERGGGGKSRLRLTLDMLRAFDGVAKYLNFSDAARHMGVTRQTLRRHLNELEEIRGVKLFDLSNNRYSLTPRGEEILPEAQEILTVCDSWNSTKRKSFSRVRGLEHATYRNEEGHIYYSQQHPLGSLEQNGLPLLKQMFVAWGASFARLDHPAMQELRPYLVVFRRTNSGWVFADVGERSAYAEWFGLEYARSAMGMSFDDDYAGDEFNNFISKAYAEVYEGGGIRLDHLHVHLWRSETEGVRPVSFQRLLAGCILPNGRQALAMLSAITNKISIEALDGQSIPQVPDDLLMDAATECVVA